MGKCWWAKLVCSSWLAQPASLYNSDPPIGGCVRAEFPWHSSLNKKMPSRFAYIPVRWWHLFNWTCLSPNICLISSWHKIIQLNILSQWIILIVTYVFFYDPDSAICEDMYLCYVNHFLKTGKASEVSLGNKCPLTMLNTAQLLCTATLDQ
jgi:hypothetical protein